MGWAPLFEAGRSLTFSAFRMGVYSRLGAYLNQYGYPLDNDLLNNCKAAA